MTQKKLDSLVEEVKTADVSEEYGPGNERWEMRPLSELMEPVLGKTPKRSEDEYWGGDVQWASAKDISQSETRHIYDTAENMSEAGKEASNAKILPAGTVVVIARGATMGRVAQLGKPMTFNQTCYALDTNDELLDDYLYYAWQYVFGQVKAVSYGTVFDTITMKSFDDIEIPVPPVHTQKEIARILTAFDDKIENNKKVNITAEKIGGVLLSEYINKYEPSEGKLPELAEFILGGTPDTDEKRYWGGPIEWSKAKAVSQSTVAYIQSPSDTISESALKETSVEIVPEDTTVVVARGATLGRMALTPREMAINQTCYGIVPRGERDRFYLYFIMKQMMRDLTSRSHGTVFETVTKSTLSEQSVPILQEDIREEYHAKVSPVMEVIKSNISESESLGELRDTLLPQLLSGALTIDWNRANSS